MQPSKIERKNLELLITWADKHQTIFTFSFLRRVCPCASCAVARSDSPDKTIEVDDTLGHSIKLVALEQTGNYAIKLAFSDGHRDGIYRYDYLRALCLCENCRIGQV